MRENKRKKRDAGQSKLDRFFERSSNAAEGFLEDALRKATSPAERKRIKALLKDFS